MPVGWSVDRAAHGHHEANLVPSGVTSPIPADISERPRAATRYLSQGNPPWRLTVVFQGGMTLHRAKGEDRIVGARPGTDPRPGRLPIWGVSVVLSGTASVTDIVARETAALRPGSWFHFAGRANRELVLNPGPGFVEMSVSTDLGLGDLLAQLGLWPDHWHAASDPDPGIVNLGWELHRALLDPVVADSSLVRRLVHLVDLVRHATGSGSAAGDGFRDRACRLLAAHPQPAYALAQAARALGFSEQAFRKRFAREVGLPPGRWQQMRRIERAAGMLLSQSVGEVAAQLGYSDTATFSRQFRQATGVSPRTLRRRDMPTAVD